MACSAHQPATDLLQDYLAGTAGSFARIVESYAPLVRAAALRRGCRQADLDDVVQETWLSLVRNAPRIRCSNALGSWLWITAGNHALRASLGAERVEPVDFGAEAEWTADEDAVVDQVSRALESETARRLLDRALARLSERDRTLIHLLFDDAEPVDYRTIGRQLDMPPGAIGPTRGRIMAKLRSDAELARIGFDRAA
ncbi:MAG: sigma-70 family RNA polymerase sigma factor [Acidimicrobiales bacterium]|nr:sigma-70 family RNA polymerase sigma factor [Acidimicrobiales bacterium]